MAQRIISDSLAAVQYLPDDALIDVRLCALLMGCSENTIWRRCRSGNFPSPIHVSPQQTRWRIGSVRAHLAVLALMSTDVERAA